MSGEYVCMYVCMYVSGRKERLSFRMKKRARKESKKKEDSPAKRVYLPEKKKSYPSPFHPSTYPIPIHPSTSPTSTLPHIPSLSTHPHTHTYIITQSLFFPLLPSFCPFPSPPLCLSSISHLFYPSYFS